MPRGICIFYKIHHTAFLRKRKKKKNPYFRELVEAPTTFHREYSLVKCFR